MSDEFAETDEWPAPQGWMRHQAETGLVPPIPATYTPASDRVVWRDRGERIAALEARLARVTVLVSEHRADCTDEKGDLLAGCSILHDLRDVLNEGNQS